jgi:hypothetical protein
MGTRMLGIAIGLVCLLAVGCGSTRYRVLESNHDVVLGSTLSLQPVTHTAAVADTGSFDASLASAVEDATPDHRVAADLDALHQVFVDVKTLRHDGERTLTTTEVAIRDRDGNTVDQLEIEFDIASDETGAGAELGRRIGYFITHREGHQI